MTDVYLPYEVTTTSGLPRPQRFPWSWPEGLPRSAVNPTLAASWVAFTGQGRLLGVTVTNTKASAQFFQLFDLAAVPADGVVPFVSVDIAANTAKSIFWGESGRWQNAGLVACNSSTQSSKTLGSADCIFDVQYVLQVV